jgi:hypothetical protein
MAFCAKCGTKLDEGIRFCTGCGSAVGGVSAGTEQQMPAAAAAEENISTADANEFRKYVDNYVRTTTKYQSATDLLENGKPSKLVLLVAVPGLWFTLWASFQLFPLGMAAVTGEPGKVLLFMLFMFVVCVYFFVLFFYILCTYPLKFVLYMLKRTITNKFSVYCEGCVDTDDFILFLNSNMKHLSVYMDKWVKSQAKKSALGAETTDAASCFNEKINAKVKIALPYEDAPIKQFKIAPPPGPEDKTTGCLAFIFPPYYIYQVIVGMFRQAGTSEYSGHYKTAPILAGVVSYYLMLTHNTKHPS